MPGAGLTAMSAGKARPDRLALKPYWGKPDVRFLGRAMETSASFEARSAPLPYPTPRLLEGWTSELGRYVTFDPRVQARPGARPPPRPRY